MNEILPLLENLITCGENMAKIGRLLKESLYVLTVFDTNRKSLLRQMSAEKGHKTRASEVPHLFDASFGSLFSVYSVVAVSR